MTDVGFYLIVTFVVLAPWLARARGAPSSRAWAVFLLAIVLIALYFLGFAHVWLPEPIGGVVTVALMTVILIRLALDLFPRDRASLP